MKQINNNMTSAYRSVDQSIKDVVNETLVRETLQRDTFGRIITLDDVDNGTTTRFVNAGYGGRLSVVQRDKAILAQQHETFATTFPIHVDRFSPHAGDILADYTLTSKIWVNHTPVDLWNFDFMGTFFGETQLMIKRFFENPLISGIRSDKYGTLVAFTFQAIANGNLLVKLKNIDTWKDRVAKYKQMKKWSREKLATYYLDNISELCKTTSTCVTIEPVNLIPVDKFRKHFVQNSIVYGGLREHDSTMMFVLYRVRHVEGCTIAHTSTRNLQSSILQKGKRKTTETEADDLIAIEQEEDNMMDIDEVEHEELVFDENDDGSDMYISDHRTDIDENDDGSDTDIDKDEDRSESDTYISDSSTDIDDAMSCTSSTLSSTSTTSGETDTDSTLSLQMTPLPTEDSIDIVDLSQMELFPHQRAMIQAVNEAPARGYIAAICGCGKTHPMTICAKSVKVSAIFVPFRILVDQVYQQYFEKDTSVEVHRVNSDYMNDVPQPHPEKSTVYIVNFDSAHRLAASNIEFDCIHWDEAHLTTSEKRRKVCAFDGEIGQDCEQIDVSTIQIKAKKQIFWTATPNNRMKTHPEVYGEEIFKYSFTEAVNDHIIKSFGMYISCYKCDDGHDDTPEDKFNKIVQITSDFIVNEKCKRILIYVNRVSDAEELISVENMRKKKNLFPSSFRIDFLSAKTSRHQRHEIFTRFKRDSDDVHVIVSCRTISVGVDLPNCDAVVFASVTKNVIEIIQRGCRPCRLTQAERESGEYSKAKIFFPVDTSALEIHEFLDRTKRNEKIHSAIRGNPLEIPMLVLGLLRDGLDIEFDFTRDSNTGGKHVEDDHDKKEEAQKNAQKKVAIPVDIAFPYSEYVWEESSEEFAETMDNLCVSLKKEPLAIEGWEKMTPRQKAQNVSDWSKMKNGIRPSSTGGKTKDSAIKLRGQWLSDALKKGYEHCISEDYGPLCIHAWWREAVEKKKEEKLPLAIEGWANMTRRERAQNVSDWSKVNNGERPSYRGGKAKDPAVKLRGVWLGITLQKGYGYCTGEDYEPLRVHEWWREAVKKKKEEKPLSIAGWKEMTPRQKAQNVSDWSMMNGERPSRSGGKKKNSAVKLRGRWISDTLSKGYEHCISEDYEPLRIHEWWRQSVEKKKEEKIPLAIEGWEEMTPRQKAQNVSEWSTTNNGERPSVTGGKTKDPAVKFRGRWLGSTLQKGYEHCMGEDYEPLRVHEWWKESVEKKKEERLPPAIEGWEEMITQQRAQNVSDWSKMNNGIRPCQKGGKTKDPSVKLRGGWIFYTLQKGYEHCTGEDYEPLRIHEWWREAVEKKKEEKLPPVIEGWKKMTPRERAQNVSDWSKMNNEEQPSRRGGKTKDPAIKLRGVWLSCTLRKGYEHCTGEDYEPLRIYEWWREAVEKKKEEKPLAIEGWKEMTTHQKAQNVSDWSKMNNGIQPCKKGEKTKDPAIKLRGSWIDNTLKKGYEHCISEDYEPLRIYEWWREAVEKKKEEKLPPAIEGWEEMTTQQKAQNVSDWSTTNDGIRPCQRGGKTKDPAIRLRGSWLGGALKKGYEHCISEDYQPLRIHEWWRQSVEKKKEEKLPPVIEGWDNMTPRQRAQNVSDWSTTNDGIRPSETGGKTKDHAIKFRGRWLGSTLQKGYEHCMGEDYEPLRVHEWWKESVEKKKEERLPPAIEGWEKMTLRERAQNVSDWSKMNDEERPSVTGGKTKDLAVKLRGSWINDTLKKGYEYCTGEDYEPLRIHEWWREVVEKKKEQKSPSAIEGWENMTPRERAQNVSNWSTTNNGERPSGRGKTDDPAIKLRGKWIHNTLSKGYEHCTGEDYEPLRIHAWWRESVENKKEEKLPPVIEGWEKMTPRERAQNVSDWSTMNNGERPSGGKTKDPAVKLRGSWINDMLKKGYEYCTGIDYEALSIHAWWRESVEKKKEKKLLPIIEGWEKMTPRQKAQNVSDWSTTNNGERPPQKGGNSKDPAIKLRGGWISHALEKKYEHCMGEDYEPLRIHAWWRESVEKKKGNKLPPATIVKAPSESGFASILAAIL